MDRPRDALAEGTELAGYIVGHVLGRGGFGITYVAVDALHADIRVAIKEFLPSGLAVREAGDVSVHPASADLAQDFAKALKRFEDEARTLVALRHPNIVDAQRFIKANGTAYVVMKYEEGSSLGQRLAEGRTLSIEELRRIVPPLLDGLEAVHARSFIHRDIKPDNIYLRSADGSPVLLDFGAARQAMAAERKASLTEIVTPGYAPFEQYDRHSAQGPYTDIYALGATLYRCVTGERPIEAPARVTAAARRLPDPLAPARSAARGDYPPALVDAIDKAMAVFEHDRPQTIAEFRGLLGLDAAAAGARAVPGAGAAQAPSATLVLGDAAAAAGPPPSQRPELPASAQSAARKARRRRTAVVAAIAATALAGSGYYALSEHRAGLERAAQLSAADEARTKAERERKRLEEERARAEAERKAAEEREARRRAEAEAAKRAEEERARAEAEAKRKAEDDARKRAEDEARKKAEDEARKRDEAKAEAERRADQEKAEADWRVCGENEHRAAIAACTRVIERGGRSDQDLARAHINRAVSHNELKQYKRAIDDCEKAIKLDPTNEDAYLNRGFAHIELRQYQRAIRDFDKAIELNPSFALAYVNRGSAYIHLGRHARAIQDLDKAITLDPQYAMAHYNRGVAYEALGNRGAAIRDYRQALRLGDKDAADRLKQLGASAD